MVALVIPRLIRPVLDQATLALVVPAIQAQAQKLDRASGLISPDTLPCPLASQPSQALKQPSNDLAASTQRRYGVARCPRKCTMRTSRTMQTSPVSAWTFDFATARIREARCWFLAQKPMSLLQGRTGRPRLHQLASSISGFWGTRRMGTKHRLMEKKRRSICLFSRLRLLPLVRIRQDQNNAVHPSPT